MNLLPFGRNAAPARAAAAFFFILGAGFANWAPRIPEIQSALGLSHGELGLALLGMPAGSVLSMPLAGWLVERLGPARATRCSMIAYCILLMGPVLAADMAGLAAGLFLMGLGLGSLDVAMNSEAAAVEQRHGRPIMSACHGLFSLGGMAGAALGGVLAQWAVPLPLHLGLGALVLLAVGLVAGRSLERVPPEPSAGPLLRVPSRALLGLALLALFAFLSEGVVMDWSTVYLTNTLGATPLLAGAGFAAFSLAMAGGRLFGDQVVLRLGPLATLRGGALLAAAGMAIAIAFGRPGSAILGFVLVGAGYATIVPILVRSAAQRPGLPPGPSIAAVVTAGYTGLLGGPPAIGLLAEGLGLAAALGLVILLSLLIALLAAPFGVERQLRLAAAPSGAAPRPSV